MPNKNLLKWWLLVVLTVSGVVIANYFDMIMFVWESDFTKISFVISFIFVITTAVIGFKMVQTERGKREPVGYEKEWMASEHLLSLGLLGTVCGLAYTFISSFENLDIGNVEAAQEVITVMALGLGSAMTTTIVGLVCSMILKSQLVIAEDAT